MGVERNMQEPEEGSRTVFHTPSPLGRETFLYPLCMGHYFCGEEYCVARNTYDSFLMMLVVKGRGYAESLGEKGYRQRIGPGQMVLMDCYEPHMYGADEEMEFYWIHFDGINARAYFRYLTQEYGCVLSMEKGYMERLMQKFEFLLGALSSERQGISEAGLGFYVTELLTFPQGAVWKAEGEIEGGLREAAWEIGKTISYMRRHFMESITVEDMAQQAAMSPYHYIRQFKRQFGITPHQYLLSLRLDCARFYLRSGDRTVKEIAFACGFQSENNFCVAFKKQTGVTPTRYRNGWG